MHTDISPNGSFRGLQPELLGDHIEASWFEADSCAHFITDNRGVVVHMNASARALLSVGRLWIDPRGRLALSQRSWSIDNLLTRAIRTGDAQRHVYQLEPDHWLGFSVKVLSRLGLGRVMINVREIRLIKDIDLRPVIEQFAISECEAPVLRGLAQATCPKEISRSLRLSIHTIRSHIRSIYAKLSVRTAAEAQQKVLHIHLIMQSL